MSAVLLKCQNNNSVQFSSVQSLSCVLLFATHESQHTRPPVHHQLPEFTQTHVHQVGDVIQPSHLLSSPSPASIFPSIRVFSNESSHEAFQMRPLFTSDGQNIGVSVLASFLPEKSKSWSKWTGWISLQSKGLSRVFSNTTVQKHQFFGAQSSSQV